MIYMVDHIYTDPATEQAWHDWYAGYLRKLLSVPGIHSAQRFKAVGQAPSRYLAMYSIDSAEVYDSPAYKAIGGGGSQSARFHASYKLWTRNLFEGAESAPKIDNGQRLLAVDSPAPHQDFPAGLRPLWLKSVGLHMSTPYRAVAVFNHRDRIDAVAGYVYEVLTPVLTPRQ